MNISNRDGKVYVSYGHHGVAGEKIAVGENNIAGDSNIVNIIWWVDKLPTEESVTPTQIKELQAAIAAFMRSDAYEEMTVKDTKPLKAAFEEYQQPQQEEKTKWKKLRDFLVGAGRQGATVIIKLTQFMKENLDVATWIKDLITPTML